MKAFLTFTFALAFFCLLAASTAVGQGVPQLINVQGKLTDAGGEPVADGSYSVLFSIYNVVTGGTALWQETRTVTVSDGLFSISLGESTTIPPSLFDNTDLWLGIQVESDLEMTPRQRLTTSPYAFRAAGSSVGGGWVDDGSVVRLEATADTVGIGTNSPEAKLDVEGGFNANQVDVGSPTQTGSFYLYKNGSANPIAKIVDYAGYGGRVGLCDELGNLTLRMEPDISGQGGFLSVRRDDSYEGFLVEGNYNGTTEPMVKVDGSARDVIFDMSVSGDASVRLPDDAISSDEILDEPGIASANYSGSVMSLTGTMQDIETVTLTIPTAGYIVLTGQCWLGLKDTRGENGADVQIDETAGGSFSHPYFVIVELDSSLTTGYYSFPTFVQRVYYKAAGEYTFRLEGMQSFGSTGNAEVFSPTLTATFYPKSYGSVATIVTASEASQFDNAVAVPTQPGEGELGSSEQLYEVDLRELELKAARLRDELKKIEAEIAEEELRKQAGDLNHNK